MILELLLAAHLKLAVTVERKIISTLVTVDGCAEHKVLHLIAQNDDVLRISSFELREDQRQYPNRWIGLPPGFYGISAEITNAGGKAGPTTHAFAMIPF